MIINVTELYLAAMLIVSGIWWICGLVRYLHLPTYTVRQRLHRYKARDRLAVGIIFPTLFFVILMIHVIGDFA
jgi:hypothetical protein